MAEVGQAEANSRNLRGTEEGLLLSGGEEGALRLGGGGAVARSRVGRANALSDTDAADDEHHQDHLTTRVPPTRPP